jgi:hypothetical protein
VTQSFGLASSTGVAASQSLFSLHYTFIIKIHNILGEFEEYSMSLVATRNSEYWGNTTTPVLQLEVYQWRPPLHFRWIIPNLHQCWILSDWFFLSLVMESHLGKHASPLLCAVILIPRLHLILSNVELHESGDNARKIN